MNDISLMEKVKTLMNIIATTPLFLFCFMIGIFVLIFYLISIKKEKNINKWIFISAWAILAIVFIINYNSFVLKLIDNFFDILFMSIYFPNITVYFIILFISNFFFVFSIFRKKLGKKYKIVNFVNALIINLFFILIMDVVKNNSIDIYAETSIYTNYNLMVLMQLNSAVFFSWILVCLFVSAHNKLKKYDKKELPKIPEIVFYNSE